MNNNLESVLTANVHSDISSGSDLKKQLNTCFVTEIHTCKIPCQQMVLLHFFLTQKLPYFMNDRGC